MLYSPAQLQEKLNLLIKHYCYPSNVPGLYKPASYIMSLAGKRLRPCLLLMGRNLFTNDLDEAMPLALAVEFFHNFTLMHDDIMDNAPLRRGETTVHEKWNNNTAILTGDAMMVEAYSLICSATAPNKAMILDVFNTMARHVCEGQQLDMEFETRNVVQLNEYLEMIRLKTAVLLGAALQIGALSAHAKDDTASLLYSFGLDMGLAFQLKDDLLDVYGTEEKFGKQLGGDILANKKTWLLLNALDRANDADKQEIGFLVSSMTLNPREKIARMTTVYDRLGIRECTEQAIDDYTTRAFESLALIDIEQNRKSFFEELLGTVRTREV